MWGSACNPHTNSQFAWGWVPYDTRTVVCSLLRSKDYASTYLRITYAMLARVVLSLTHSLTYTQPTHHCITLRILVYAHCYMLTHTITLAL